MMRKVLCLVVVLSLVPAMAGALGPGVSPYGVALDLCSGLKSSPYATPPGVQDGSGTEAEGGDGSMNLGPGVSPYGAALEWLCSVLDRAGGRELQEKLGPGVSPYGVQGGPSVSPIDSEPAEADTNDGDSQSVDLGPGVSPYG